MADELDRVRISAAELRAEASTLTNHHDDCHREERGEEGRGQRQQRHHGNDPSKRPDLQRYTPGAGHGNRRHDSEDGGVVISPGDLLAMTSDPEVELVMSLPQEEEEGHNMAATETVSTEPGCIDGGMGKGGGEKCGGGFSSNRGGCSRAPAQQRTRRGDHHTTRADNNNNSSAKGPSGSANRPQNSRQRDEVRGKNQRGREPAGRSPGSPKATRKTRKPDREIYQPGGRRSTTTTQGEEGRETEKPAPGPPDPVREESQARREPVIWREKEEDGRGGEETGRRQGRRETGKAAVSDHGVENLTGKIQTLCVTAPPGREEEGKRGEGEEGVGRRRKASGEGRRSRAGGGGKGRVGGGNEGCEKTEEEEKKKRERGNRRNRGGGEKGENQDSRRRGGEGERGMTERDRRVSEEDGEREANRPVDAQPAKGREKQRDRDTERDNQRGNNRPQPLPSDINREKNVEMQRNRDRSERCRANTNNHHHSSSSSKHNSKSNIRRPRNRTYSTSSASSGTSLDGLGQGDDRREDRARRDRLGHRERDGGEGGGGQLPNRRRNTRDSSTDSLEERRRAGGEEYLSPLWRRGEEESRGGRGHRGGGRGGLLKVSQSDRQSGTSHATSGPSDDPQGRLRQGTLPRGKERGILILPAHTDLSNLPTEPGPRLLFGGIRGGKEVGLGRGGRGGGTRRLWDPNNPDQKPALRLSQHASLQQQQPMYLQTGGGYGALHFLDTDDEAAGSPPVRQGEHFYPQQEAAAMAQAFYKYQNSDNPYPYNANPNARYPYPYHTMPTTPYQMPSSNGIYPAQFYGEYRGQGYQTGAGAGLTPEEVEQQARGELGRQLRAADSQELQLSNLLSRDRLSADGLDRMAQLRADLLTLYERVILTDIEFSDSQNLDQALWKNVFYQVIEHFRQLLKDPSGDSTLRITPMLLTLLDEGTVFFDALLQKLQTVFQFKLEDYMDGMAIRPRPLRKTVKYALISAQRCLICQGDIARYREQASDSANYGKARSWYLKAQQIAPKNGRPYNQLALLAVYTKRKLDAVYYYMRSLAASNPILTAKESLMSLFEEAKRKADQMERRRKQESEGGSRGPGVRGGGRGEEGARVEIWVGPIGQAGVPSSHRGGSESSRDSEQEGELGNLSPSDLNKRFTLSFLHAHGKLFTKVGMESFPSVASRVLQEFTVLLQHSPSPLGSTRMLQIITINMFTIHNAQSRGGDSEVRSVLQEQTTALGLAMFSLLVQRCTELLRDTPADLCNALARVDHGEAPLYKADGDGGEGDEELRLLLLEEDRLLAPASSRCSLPHRNPAYAIAADCKRVTVLKYFLEALCGQEEPLLAFKGGKYVSMATSPQPGRPGDARSRQDSQTERESDDVIVEAESSVSDGDDGSEDDIRELRARRSALTNKLAEQQRRRDKIQAVLQTCGQLELEVRPLFLVPDTNGFIDHLTGLKTLLQSGTYIVVVPLIVITELDGLAKGQESCDGSGSGRGGSGCRGNTGGGGPTHHRSVQEKAKVAVAFLERGFEAREPCLRALTSRGSQLESIAFRSEDTSGQQGNNDDVILSCCLHYCKDEAKSLMPAQTNGPVRLRREVVLLTDDRNLRVKALTRNVPVRDIPAFLTWAKVG
ncbi:telomerase-binding protein EST1A [Oncorhynchus kisutch]|uniref:telomerase-binding protein EST1A n=1 Tax=Oncorhynchus kisutch TaxID=8019 RepID=UPI0012DEF8B8|nr:telomerase-binding protein EST1A-like [Oncorhynchus kisutch]